MNRDMDVIRQIVLAVRDSNEPIAKVEGMEPAVFNYHAQLLDEAGLVKASLGSSDKRLPTVAMIFRLTWAGHDFADSITDDTLWQKAKDTVIKPTASWTFGILLEYLKVEIRSHIPGL